MGMISPIDSALSLHVMIAFKVQTLRMCMQKRLLHQTHRTQGPRSKKGYDKKHMPLGMVFLLMLTGANASLRTYRMMLFKMTSTS